MVRCLWFYTQRFREHLLILEQKTGKQNYIALNKNAKNALRWYMDACFPQESDYLFAKHRPAASHQPFAGIPHCKRSRSPNHKQPHGQLSLHAENVWLPRMETGSTARTAYGFVQSLFLWCHQTLSWNWAGWKGFCLFENRSVIKNLKFFIFGVKFQKSHPI